MLNRVIAFSLKNRLLVLIAAAGRGRGRALPARRTPVDVFPDLNRPTVTIMTEAPGLAPEEVEVAGHPADRVPAQRGDRACSGCARRRASGCRSCGSSSTGAPTSTRTGRSSPRSSNWPATGCPQDVNPVMAPISSIMGEIMLVGLRPAEPPKTPEEALQQAMELRTLGEFTVRNRLLAVEGVSQVTVMGGVLKQYQVVTSPERLAAQNVTLQQLTEAAEKANVLAGGGVMERGPKESLIRISGQSLTPEEIEETPGRLAGRPGRPHQGRGRRALRRPGPARRRQRAGEGRRAGRRRAVGHPDRAEAAGREHAGPDAEARRGPRPAPAPTPRPGVVIERHVFRQADFIQTAIDNVVEAIRDGTIWVFVVLFLFLWNFRTSVITLTAIPLSILITVLVFSYFGVTINTMTLGGIAVAVGELVDDAIVDVENIFRRLKENRARRRTPTRR